MLLLGITLLFLTGWTATTLLCAPLSHAERIGLSFPLGTAIVTFAMLLLDAAGLPLTGSTLLLLTGILLLALACGCFRCRTRIWSSLVSPVRLRNYNLVWLVLLGFVCWLEYANLTKCLYFPTYDRDSMTAFDTLGYLIAQEHTLKGLSVFSSDYVPQIHCAGSPIAYCPMLQLAYAYVYSLGAETSKLIPGLMYLSFLVAFYGVCCRLTSRTFAMLATFMTLLTPEMTAFSSLSATNVMHAVFASLGIIYMLAWRHEKKGGLLLLSSALLAANVWIRQEGIVFIAVAGFFVLWDAVRSRSYRTLLPILLASIPLAVWMAFMKIFALTSASVLIAHPFWDGDKIGTIWHGFVMLLFESDYYGWTFTAASLAIIANMWFFIKRKDSLAPIVALLLGMALYLFLIYQIDYTWDSIENVISYSVKRFFFCFVPLAWYFVFTCRAARVPAMKFETWLSH